MNHVDPDIRSRLIDEALAARQRAYAPYSGYLVGAALMTADGSIYTGCNIENAAHTPTMCAERVAVAKAVSDGHLEFDTIVVATPAGGVCCGVCRQVLNEFTPNVRILTVNDEGTVIYDGDLTEVLPYAWGPKDVAE